MDPLNPADNSQNVPVTSNKQAVRATEQNPTDTKIAKVTDILSQTIADTSAVSSLSEKKITANYDDRRPELKEKDSHMWVCVTRKIGPNGGFIYGYRFRNEFADKATFDSKNLEIYPAVEPSFKDLAEQIMPTSNDAESQQYGILLRKLGFSIENTKEGTIVYMPDREAIVAGWSQAQADRLEQSHAVIQKVKTFKPQDESHREWQNSFIPELKKMYLEYLNPDPEREYDDDYNSDYAPKARALIQERWGPELVEKYMKVVDDFCNNNVHSTKDVADDKVWEKLQGKLNNFSLDVHIDRLSREYSWIPRELIKDALLNPSEETLNSFKERMQLPELRIESVEGISPDRDYVKGRLDNDAYMSKNNEIIHDTGLHVIPALLAKYRVLTPKQQIAQDNLTKEVASCFDKLELLRRAIEAKKDVQGISLEDVNKSMFTLGLYVDSMYNLPNFSNRLVEIVWTADVTGISTPNPKLWKERYPNEPLDVENLKKTWNTILHTTG